MTQEMYDVIDNALVPWKEIVAKTIADKMLDQKTIIKLPCTIELPGGIKANSLSYIKCGNTIHTIFAYYEDGKAPNFCVTKEVGIEIAKHLLKDKNESNG